MSLKTLENLVRKRNSKLTPTIHCDDGREYGGAIPFVFLGELKTEVINWVKECREMFGNSSTCDFWMGKLNTTEEDLSSKDDSGEPK